MDRNKKGKERGKKYEDSLGQHKLNLGNEEVFIYMGVGVCLHPLVWIMCAE